MAVEPSQPCYTHRGRRLAVWSLVAVALLAGTLLAGCRTLRDSGRSLPAADNALATARSARTPLLVPTTTRSPAKTPTLAGLPTGTPEATPTETAESVPTQVPTTAPRSTPAVIRAKIEVVWPHGGASVRDANLANITAYLISESGNNAPPCDWEPTVRLWTALNSQPARPAAVGQKRMFTTSGRTFPVWDFNDVDVSAARDPANKLTFFVTVDGVRTLHNIWTHAADARTVFPQPNIPTGTVARQPSAVDGRIQIVWPHDNLPVEKATLANITAYLFAAGTQQAVPPTLGWSPTARLHQSLNTDTEKGNEAATGSDEIGGVIGTSRVITTEGGIDFLAWDFNNIDVSAARDPMNKIYFWVSVDDVPTFPNVWAHGTNTPTMFAQTDILNSCQ